ncbi:MAG TPA: PQQ-binding-like beta-propeller repeat protein [Polyangiales bacterium]|nr:PQQ-binding-like beta-propeller repeat protein [Polyangiales bacterium]
MKAAALCLLALCSCSALHRDEPLKLFGTGGSDMTRSGRGALRVEWRKELTPARRGNYRPIENAVAAIDEQHGRVYVGATSGALHALNYEGKPLYRFELHDSIESEPALDPEADELYVGTERGELYAFTPSSGKLRWKVQSGAALRQKPMLFRDAIYVLTEEDVIESRARADGAVLWSYKRDRSEGFLVAGHSGLALTDDGLLLSGFNDGTVVALDALDGRPKWERPTLGDVPEVEPGRPRYVDVDTTPVKIGGFVYAASFGAGIYCLDANNGSVVWRAPEWTGITGLAAADDSALIVVSADKGIARFELATRSASWIKPNERGSFGVPQLARGAVLLGDSKGSLVALGVADGSELGRIDAGHGFLARTSTAGARGYVVTNGGTLLAMRVVLEP